MALIKQIVQGSLTSGFLSPHAENQLQRLFHQGCDLDDIDALVQLQQAILAGQVYRFGLQQPKAIHANEVPGEGLHSPMPLGR